jgi:cytochrome c553
MKQGAIGGLLLFLGLSAAGVSAAQRPETLDEMKTRAAQVPVEEKVRVCASVARRAVDEAKDRFARGIDDEGRILLRDVEAYADKAAEAAIQSKKHEKQLEIDLRDLSHHLDALKHELGPEDQPAAVAAIGHLEKLRTRLLESMFGKGKH